MEESEQCKWNHKLQVEVWILPSATAKKMIHSQFERGSSSSAPSGTPVDSHLRRLYSAQEVLLEFSFVVLLLACFLLVTFASRLLRDDACCNGSVTVWRFLKSYAEDAKQPICFVPFNLNGVYQMQANHTQLPWEVQQPRAQQYAGPEDSKELAGDLFIRCMCIAINTF